LGIRTDRNRNDQGIFGVLALLINLGGEIAADAMEVDGDRKTGSRSLPVSIDPVHGWGNPLLDDEIIGLEPGESPNVYSLDLSERITGDAFPFQIPIFNRAKNMEFNRFPKLNFYFITNVGIRVLKQ
jgi:hypothetical protein